MIILKLIFIVVVLVAITPFVMMASVFIGGGAVAPGTSEKEKNLTFIGIWAVLALVYLGFPALILFLL